MTVFAADPESLRSSAKLYEGIRDDAGSFTESCASDLGHDAITAGLSEVAGMVGTAWSQQAAALEEIASRLRTSADLYEQADTNSALRDDGSAP
ncbi:type VII secretion target [Microbacterium sp. BWR-S6Y]|uniref:type VII secretion target n=1 Tax=Microbacterium sp. BWR-S6Y TaxID=3232073 RepID=UPI003528CE5C